MILTHSIQTEILPRKRKADEVVVVCNLESPASRDIAADYQLRRKVNGRVEVSCPDSAVSSDAETISYPRYESQIETPLRAYLAKHPKIDFIVLTKGVPIRVSGASMGSCDENSKNPKATRGYPSVDSLLASLDYSKQADSRKVEIHGSGAIGTAYCNRYWNANEPFSHQKFGGYLVSRLDGYTVAAAKALVTQSLKADSVPTERLQEDAVLLDVQPKFGLGDKTQPAPVTPVSIPEESAYSDFNADMIHTSDLLTRQGVLNELELTPSFVGNRSQLIGYFSWGSNDPAFTDTAYRSLTFAPGSLCDTAVSTSARTFLSTRGGQSLIADLLTQGLTCVKGYVGEPLLQAIASPSIALDRYVRGYTMAESFYAASRFVGWEDVVLGDPLCAAFRGKK